MAEGNGSCKGGDKQATLHCNPEAEFGKKQAGGVWAGETSDREDQRG